MRFLFGMVVGVPILLFFGILIVHGYFVSRTEAARTMREMMVAEVRTRAKTLNNHLALMARNPDQIAQALSIRKPADVAEMLSFQYAMLADNPSIYGNAVAWEPFAFDPNRRFCSPYVWRDPERNGAVANMMFNPENNYDYLSGWDWYDHPKQRYGGPSESPATIVFVHGDAVENKLPRIEPGLWCAPYFDEGGGNVLMCTYSAPFFRDRRFSGVVTCDVTTDWIADFLSQESFEGAFFALLGNNGEIISHPDAGLIMKRLECVANIAERPDWKGIIDELKSIAAAYRPDRASERLPDHEATYLPTLSREVSCFAKGMPLWIEGVQLPSTGWVLLLSVPRQTVYRSANAHFQGNVLIFLLGLTLFSTFLFWHIDRRIIRPLTRLSAATRALAEGDFEHHIEPSRSAGRELIGLAHNFNVMAGNLRQSIDTAVRNASEKEAAEAANEAKSEFLMLVSHELRTPLSGSMGATELLEKTDLTPKQREYVDLLMESGAALLLLIDNLLDYSKLETAGISMQVKEFDLRESVASVCSLLHFQARSRNLDIVRRIAETIPDRVRGDEHRIRQVLSNLLSNAVKFTRSDKASPCETAGEVRLNIDPDPEDARGDRVRFEVVDHGVGVEPGRYEELFSLTWQGNMSSKRIHDGMGLGLAISKYIVDSLGGRIGVHATPGGGATFWFSLPLPAATEPAPAASGLDDGEKSDTDQALACERHAGAIRILVAEDNRINQIVINEVLGSAGYDCVIVGNGREAVRTWSEGMFDLILMDCQMPEVDGYEATRLIREQERLQARRAATPIIALTANAAPGDKEYCLEIGMNSYCNKPINAVELIDTIRTWIE